jgi:hypothetical protein
MDRFWLTDEQFAKLAPHLPTDTRGKQRVDDRRVISGTVHVLKSGGRWADAPAEAEDDALQPLRALGCLRNIEMQLGNGAIWSFPDPCPQVGPFSGPFHDILFRSDLLGGLDCRCSDDLGLVTPAARLHIPELHYECSQRARHFLSLQFNAAEAHLGAPGSQQGHQYTPRHVPSSISLTSRAGAEILTQVALTYISIRFLVSAPYPVPLRVIAP